MRRTTAWLLGVLLVAAACAGDAGTTTASRTEVVAEGLLNPLGLAMLPDGGILVAEEGTGDDDASAGVSLVADGRVDRVVSGLPSGRDSGDLSGVPLVGLAPDDSTVYTAHFGAGSLLTFPAAAAEAIDTGVVLGPSDLQTAMEPLNRVQLVNPFDIAFSADGRPVVTDASGNGVAVETADGRTEFIHRFGELRDPADESLRIDAVPTGIARVEDEYYVALFGGCPYPEGAGRIVAIDGEQGERIVADGLTMPIDVSVDPAGQVWVLEFARFDPEASCFSGAGYEPGTGRLSRLVDGELETVVDGLDFPGAMLVAPDGSVYVSEVFAGRVVRIIVDPSDAARDAAAPTARPWRFTDVAAESGIDFTHGAFATGLSDDPVAMMGGGVCWIDVEGDGDLDLYLVNSHATAEREHWNETGGLPANALYRNDGGTFVETSDSGANLTMRGNGCLATDVDGDGDTDLYVTADGPNALLVNDGDGVFVDRAAEAGVAAAEWSTAAAAGDVDGDGVVDLFVGSYIDLELKIDKPSGAFPQDYIGIGNHLFLGRGDGTFEEVIADTPLLSDDRTLGALMSDLDGDGALDLYVANDGQPNTLYQNTGGAKGLFADVTRLAGVGDSGSGMGVAGGDFDGDGETDLMVTNWEAELHALYRRNPDTDRLVFRYSTDRIGFAGLGRGETGWGTAWADFDHDTDLDLFIANGRVPVTDLTSDPEPLRLFGNLAVEGHVGELREWSQRTGLDAVGPLLARGAAVGDYDNDGDLDIAINQIAGPAVLLRNEGTSGAFLVVMPDPPLPGARAEVTFPHGSTVVRELQAGSSYLSSHDPRLHFGLGTAGTVDVAVRWPDGSSAELTDVAPNQIISVPAG